MSHRDRGPRFAVVSCILIFTALCLSFAAAFDFGRSKGVAVGENIANSNTYTRHAQQEIQDRCLVADPVASAVCIRDVIEATNEHQRAEDDLEAQTDMALWAFGMLVVTAIMAAVTSIGVFFVWKTLKATQDMAKDAARTTDAAIAAVSVPNRAWITTEMEKLSYQRTPDGGIDFYVELRITNVGKTPALNTHTMITAIIDYDDAPEAVAELARGARVRDTRSSRLTFPDQSYVRRWGPHIGPDAIYQTRVATAAIIGVVTYETLFDPQLHQTAFAFGVQYPGKSIEPGDIGDEGKCTAFVISGGFAD